MISEYELPLAYIENGIEHKIRNSCDYRVIFDVMDALDDVDLPMIDRLDCALFIFYEDYTKIKDIEAATVYMYDVIRAGEAEQSSKPRKGAVIDWKKDFKMISPPVSRVLGYDVRTTEKITHWWTFLDAFAERGECLLSTVLSIRTKQQNGEKLEKWEQKFMRENYELVNVRQKLPKEIMDYLTGEL